MADESLHGPRSAFDLAKVAGADVFAVKLEQSGGAYAAQQVAAIADAAGIELYGGTMLEGAVGTVISAHVFATFANLQWGTELFGPLLLTEEILAEPLDYSDFQLTVPDGPGLGITLDEDRVQFFRRDRATRTVRLASATHANSRKGACQCFPRYERTSISPPNCRPPSPMESRRPSRQTRRTAEPLQRGAPIGASSSRTPTHPPTTVTY